MKQSPNRKKPVRKTGGRNTKRNAKKPRTKASAPAVARPPAPAPVLSASQRKHMRGLSHHFEPLVQVGHAGVTPAVVVATQRALLDHELIKVRLHEPEDKKRMAAELAELTASALCGLIGHTVILFRPHPEHPQFPL